MKIQISAFTSCLRRNNYVAKLLFSLSLLFVVLFSVSCTSPNITCFPVQKENGVSLLAIATGELIIEDGCLRVKSGDTSSLLIWPYGYSYRISGNKVEVLNEKGEVVARTGQVKKFGGGEVELLLVIDLIDASLPENCVGPCWLVGEVLDK